MTQEYKQLLLKDFCARLPYGVKILHRGWNYEWDDELSTVEKVVGIDEDFIYTKVIDTHNGKEYRDDKWPIDTFDDKLFLRPMSSMTEEEYNSINWNGCQHTIFYDKNGFHFKYIKTFTLEVFDWLLKNHFDFMGLIEKSLALEAPEGMYKVGRE